MGIGPTSQTGRHLEWVVIRHHLGAKSAPLFTKLIPYLPDTEARVAPLDNSHIACCLVAISRMYCLVSGGNRWGDWQRAKVSAPLGDPEFGETRMLP